MENLGVEGKATIKCTSGKWSYGSGLEYLAQSMTGNGLL
jgi:hypothetical protein